MKNLKHKAFIKQYFKEAEEIIRLMPVQDINKIIDILFDAWRNDAIVFVMGNGGSASTASHFAADLTKYTIMGKSYNENKKRFKVICLTDNAPLISAWTNDSGFNTIFTEQLKPWIKKGDVVFGFSVHGGSLVQKDDEWSQNITKAFAFAKNKGATLIGLAGDTGGAMKSMSDACVVVPTVNKETITTHSEGFHLIIHHLIIHRLKELIGKWKDK